MVRTTPDDEFDVKLLADVEEHGWHLVAIEAEDDSPAYVFSVGIYHTLKHPEICIFGLSSCVVMGQIINYIGELIQAGQTFNDGTRSDEILEGFACMFRAVTPNLYREYFGYDIWFYEGFDFPVVQCVWPDKAGFFPWESEYDAQLVWAQPVLVNQSEWPFVEDKNTAIFTTRQIIEEDYPILYVSHDEDGDWQFLCGTSNATADGRIVSLKTIIDTHPTMAELADLPPGWNAFREGPDDPWERVEAES